MSSVSYCLIVNPFSNSGRALKVLKRYESEILEKLTNAELYVVKKEDSISEIAFKKAEKFDVVVACGGDGTARNVGIGIRDTEALFGLIPIGSGNDFARMLNLSNSISENIDVLKRASYKEVDLVSFNDKYFINTLGIGFGGLTNYYASNLRNVKGSFKYLFAGLKALRSYKPFEVQIKPHTSNLKTYTTPMVIVANGKWEGGGFLISPDSVFSDSEIELIIIKKSSKFRLTIEFIRLSLGLSLSKNISKKIKGSNFLINTSEPVYVHADGEVEKKESEFDIRVYPKKIRAIQKI